MPEKRKPSKRKAKKKKDVVFDVPADVKRAPQSGWVYRTSPAGGAPPVAPSHHPAPRPAAPRPHATAGGSALDAFLMPFTLPLCLILSLLPASSPKQPSK